MFIERVLITPRKRPQVHKYLFRTSFRNFTGKTPVLESLFKKVAGPQACNFIEKRFQHSCFPVKFAKFFRAHFFTEGLWWLLFKISNSNNPTICSKIFHQYPLRTKNIGNRTISPWIITPRTIVPRIIAPRTIAPQTIGPQDNCPPG